MFNKKSIDALKNNEEAKELRTKECMNEIMEVLQKHDCILKVENRIVVVTK